MNQSVKVFAPATVANVSCGYDVLGFAVNAPGDEVIMSLNDSQKVTLDQITGDEGRLPREPAKNTVSAVVINYLTQIGAFNQGVSIALHKKMPFGSGLGSSSASAVAGLVAINALMGNRLSREELLPMAMEGERLACGNAHADNVAPALLGGMVLIRSYAPLDVVKLPFPQQLYAGLVYPHVEIPTSKARKIIKPRIALGDAVTQWGNVAGLVAGFCTGDTALIGRSMQDVIIEPVRAMLIPYFYAMRKIANEAGALGFSISGSGPTVFSLSEGEETAQRIVTAQKALLNQNGIEANAYVSAINAKGAEVISQ